jgi:hypothetical protein
MGKIEFSKSGPRVRSGLRRCHIVYICTHTRSSEFWASADVSADGGEDLARP